MKLSKMRRLYRETGVLVLPRFVAASLVDAWRRRALELFADAVAVEVDRAQTEQRLAGDQGDARRHRILDGHVVEAEFPSLLGWYEAARHFASAVVDREVICSPYSRSAVNIKHYSHEDSHGWHYDTNAVTALVYLTDDGHGTEVVDLCGSQRTLVHGAGTLLLMQGRRVRHRVPTLFAKVDRITVPLNYYHPDDLDRPPETERLVYGD